MLQYPFRDETHSLRARIDELEKTNLDLQARLDSERARLLKKHNRHPVLFFAMMFPCVVFFMIAQAAAMTSASKSVVQTSAAVGIGWIVAYLAGVCAERFFHRR